MVVRMRHTRSQTRQRRSHHALVAAALSTCSHCGALHLPHHMCRVCGYYNGRQVMDLETEKRKRDARLKERRESMKVSTAGSGAPTAPEKVRTTKEELPSKDEPRVAKGASAKRKKDESLSGSSTGTN